MGHCQFCEAGMVHQWSSITCREVNLRPGANYSTSAAEADAVRVMVLDRSIYLMVYMCSIREHGGRSRAQATLTVIGRTIVRNLSLPVLTTSICWDVPSRGQIRQRD